MATYAIGDIHGCYNDFCRLLDTIHFSPPQDSLWFVGDVVNRGPASLQTLRWIYAQREHATLTLGNHDLHLLAVAAGAATLRSDDTISDIINAPDGEELCNWLRRQRLAHYQHGWLMVHAGVLPMWDVQKVLTLAAEVESVIGGDKWHTFVHQMYGDLPAQWDDTLTTTDRWRVIINALTRLRICTPAGAMEQPKYTGLPNTVPRGYVPWFETPDRNTLNIPIVCGHWSALGAMQKNNMYAIDSGCLWGGQLTALRLQDRKLFQVTAEK